MLQSKDGQTTAATTDNEGRVRAELHERRVEFARILFRYVAWCTALMVVATLVLWVFAPQFAQLLPATHAMNAMNGLAMGFKASYSPWGSVLALIACGLLAFTLAIYMFSWDRQNSTQRGHPLLAILVLVPFVVGIFVF